MRHPVQDRWCGWHPAIFGRVDPTRRPPVKDQVVAIFDLCKEEPVLTARFFAFAFFEEWSQIGEPFLPATQQVVGGQGIYQFLKLLRMAAFEECIRALLKIDPFGAHPVGHPVGDRNCKFANNLAYFFALRNL
jgi:hypothetical protein